ncbi:MAG: organic solvent tolerance ABC transporter substrate-binding protein [Nitrospira bacterium HGW-Nitrospira-1]|nr:MAG: organic solvent tolerance ABC transporter substrate-binding protein [Nitrospira bacterium HGW-Nitrospira-1]
MRQKIAGKLLVLLLGILIFCLFPHKTTAGEPTDQVKETVDSVIKILNNKDLKKPEKRHERSSKIRAAIEKRFDFEEMAKRSLALHWKNRTPREQEEFVSLFSDLLEDTYIKKIERYEDEKVNYTDERTDGSYAVVRTKIITAKEIEIPVDYKIFKKGQKWEIYDIVIEGVSLVNNYRTQFNQIIRSGSYEELIKKLRKKTVK